MTNVIWIDANIPTYAFGREHRLRAPCKQILALAGQEPTAFLTDAEVLQELLHRYTSLKIWEQAKGAFREFTEIVRDRVEPIFATDVEAAAALATKYVRLSARDLIRTAVMQRVGSARIVSADRGFDQVDGIERLDPATVGDWRDTITPNRG
jgi:predicted nucleic acid-binding protein